MTKQSERIIAVSAAVLLVAVAIIYVILSSNKIYVPKGTIGALAGNLYNDGLFNETDGLVYFSNPYDEDCLYVMNPDQRNIKKVYNLSARFINVGGDNIFFSGKAVSQTKGLGTVLTKPGMYMVSKKGTHLTTLTKDKSQSLLLIDNTIYYQHYTTSEGATFHGLNIKNHNSEELLPFLINPASYYQGKIYYSGMYDDHNLYTYDTSTHENADIWEGDIYNPIFDGEYVYYMDVRNNYRLCRYSPSLNQIEILCNDRLDTFNLYGDTIFYAKSSPGRPQLIRMKADGSAREIIAEGVFNSINCTSSYTYFKEFGKENTMFFVPTFGGTFVSEFVAAKEAVSQK